jgi:PAS domain S-box-containing protein
MTFDRFVAVVLPDDHDRVLASIDGALTGSAPYDMECRIVRPNGEVRTIHCRGEVVRDSGGQPLRMSGTALDVTDRKRTELALQQREAHCRALIEHSSDIITILDPDGRVRFESPSFERLLGYSQHELDGRIAFEFVHEEDLAVVMEKFQALIQQPGMPQIAEFRFRHKNGSWRSFEGIGRMIQDPEGQWNVIVNSRDVTERKRAEVLLRTSQDRLQQALHASGIGLWEWNTQTNEVTFSEEWKRQLGYEAGEIADTLEAWTMRLHPDDRVAAMTYVQDYVSRREGDYRQEFRLQHKDGRYRWIEARAAFVTEADGRRIRLLGSHTDITDRKRMEAAVRESEEWYRTLVELSPSGVFVFSEGRTAYINHTGALLLGANDAQEILDRPTFAFIHPDYHQAVRENVRRLLSDGASVHGAERIYLKMDGTPMPVQVEAARITWNGKPAILGLFSDITERKQAEEALRASEERFAKAFQASPHPVVICELDSGRVVDVNEAASRMMGYRKEDVEGQTTLQIGLWSSVEERDRFIEQLKSRGSVRNMEVTLLSKDGEARRCLVSSELIEVNGKQCSVTVGDDITESKRLENALRLTQFSVDHAVEAIVWLDPNARIFNVNETACRMLAYSRQDLLMMTIHDIDPNFPVERWAEHWNYLKQQGALTFEAKFWSRTGGVLETDVTVNYLQYDGKEYGCMILRDVGERKRAEAELRRSHTFLRQVIDTAPGFIFAKDRDGHFTMANKAVADWYGTTVEDVIGKSEADFDASKAEEAFFRQGDHDVIDSGRERFIPEARITDGHGKTRWFQAVKRPIFDDCGRVHMILGVATDITERKRMEEMLRQRERDLSAALEERERISQDLHDGILQSLYAVGLGLETCKPLIKNQPTQVAEPLMAMLDHAIGQLNHVMAEVRNFIAGLESQVMQGGDFSTALRTMVETMLIASSARCRVRIDEAAAKRLSTEYALHVINIVREGVSNALRHSRAKQITVSLRSLLRSDRLVITDDGVGFDVGSVQGVGHGLANMAARAQKVRGLFAIQSKPDKGTRISLDLPKETHHARNKNSSRSGPARR